jgi:hypothetical protein
VHDEEDLEELEDADLDLYDDEVDPLGLESLGAEDGEDDGPPYAALALLLRTRLETLPEPRRPAGARAHAHLPDNVSSLPVLLGPRPASAKLPVTRKKSNGPAPIYQIKVALVGTRPPIWRRLLVPADLSLASLHDAIQAAFGWDGSHLHVFQTSYGDFGQPDRELGYLNERPVNLEQIAPKTGDKLRYTYDFGDDWVHEIVVEKSFDRDPALAYPRCTGGRRAAPPDDCGGIWGYEQLLEALADPHHAEHEDRLDWLGLEDAAEFDPAAFDLDEVNQALAQVAPRPR